MKISGENKAIAYRKSEKEKEKKQKRKIIDESGIWTHALSDQNLNLAP